MAKSIAGAAIIAAIIFIGCAGDDDGVLGNGGRHFNAEIAYGSLTDVRDGKTYRTVRIGELEWMAQNLDYEAGKSWNYANSSSYSAAYGRLYDWYTAAGVCPVGWRLPTDEDWIDLIETAVNLENGEEEDEDDFDLKLTLAAGKLKSRIGWNDDGGGTDEFGFSALPGGFGRSCRRAFIGAGSAGFWWGATEHSAWIMGAGEGLQTYIIGSDAGLSVRCVRNAAR